MRVVLQVAIAVTCIHLFMYSRALVHVVPSIARVRLVPANHHVTLLNYNVRRLKMASFASSSFSSSAETGTNSVVAPSSSSSSSSSTSSSRAQDIILNTQDVSAKMADAATKAGRAPSDIRLVAVSKTKPREDIQALYDSGHRDFGENYFQELVEKAEALPKDIQWHFIGHLQSAKASKLVREVPNLTVVETVDSLKLAKKLNTALETLAAEAAAEAPKRTLKVYIQVDTSGEDTKSGVPVSETAALAAAIRDECPLLTVAGLMTIGAPGDFGCFDRLVEARVDAAAALGVPVEQLGLSMGMSGD